MRRDDVDLAYASGREAVAALILAQAARIDELVAANARLAARVEELERQAGRSSRSSSLPPSRDSPDAHKARPKSDSERKQGGQRGHRGEHREMVADLDWVVEYWPSACDGCGAPIGEASRVCDGDPVGHQVSEIVVRTEVTEHQRMRVRCRCGRCTLAELPAGVPARRVWPSGAGRCRDAHRGQGLAARDGPAARGPVWPADQPGIGQDARQADLRRARGRLCRGARRGRREPGPRR